jgi:hypothetical protein
MLGAPESGHSFRIFTSLRQHAFASVRSAVSNPAVNQARVTGEVRLDDEIRPYEAERLAVLAVNGRLRSNFVAARFLETENRT